MRLDMTFFDKDGNPTGDYIKGSPMVQIRISVGFEMPEDEPETITVAFATEWALVDTGASNTFVVPELAAGKRSLANTTMQTPTGTGTSETYLSMVEIPPFQGQHFSFTGAAPLGGIRAILGRDIISKFKMVYDVPNGEFYLESV